MADVACERTGSESSCQSLASSLKRLSSGRTSRHAPGELDLSGVEEDNSREFINSQQHVQAKRPNPRYSPPLSSHASILWMCTGFDFSSSH
eukprot:992342-Rhodomonas_salina.2